jgi:hypothetical protein
MMCCASEQLSEDLQADNLSHRRFASQKAAGLEQLERKLRRDCFHRISDF